METWWEKQNRSGKKKMLTEQEQCRLLTHPQFAGDGCRFFFLCSFSVSAVHGDTSGASSVSVVIGEVSEKPSYFAGILLAMDQNKKLLSS